MLIFLPKRLAAVTGVVSVIAICACQLAVTAAWLKDQAEYLARPHFLREDVLKITGSNSSEEKARVMALFREPRR